jgi:methylase of polypeptide subunit release factors
MMPHTIGDARSFLRALGYGDDLVLTDYPVWLGTVHGTARADAVAFGRSERLDMSTATITVSVQSLQETYNIAQALASPYMILATDDHLDLWIVDPSSPQLWHENISPSDAPLLAEWLRPAAALSSKLGLRQLPLFDFPVNLLAAARSRGAERLGPIIRDALNETARVVPIPKKADPLQARRYRHRRAARLVVTALTSLVLRDRNNWRNIPALELVDEAARNFPTTYGWYAKTTQYERRLLSDLIQQLGKGIDYESLDPTVLSHVYEEGLVYEDDRGQLGIHYTPPLLANRLVQELPVELIAPDKRNVLDPACGSGTMLVAVHDRLWDLQPKHWSASQRQQDLAVHLRGIDIDPFAVEIAQLTLLLNASPARNGWKIEEHDTIKLNPKTMDCTILVTNPPWKYHSEQGERHQAASDFVSWSVKALAPGGLLGIVLPQSWLSANYSSQVRNELTEALDVFEIWRLPEGIFESSAVASSVLLARKRDGLGGHGHRMVREIQKSEVKRFFEEGNSKIAYVVPDTADDIWKRLTMPDAMAPTQQLGTLATILSGPQPKSGISDLGRGTPYLDHFGTVSPYAAVTDPMLWRVNFPDDFQTGRGASIIGKKKVLVSAARNPSNPWQLRVALDPVGIAARNSVRGVAPYNQEDADLLYALLILLGSGFANSFVASFGAERNIPARALKEIPVPTDSRAIGKLADLGREASEAADQGDQMRLFEIMKDAEQAVWDAYGISERDRIGLTRRLGGHVAPEGQWRYEAPSEPGAVGNSTLRRFGCVLESTGYTLRVWVNGVTPEDGIDVYLPWRLPGWLLRPGATFDILGVETAEDLQTAIYRFQPASWSDLALDELEPRPLLPS